MPFIEEDYIKCPECHEAIILDDQGCKFVKCHCGKSFCALCLKIYEESKHYSPECLF